MLQSDKIKLKELFYQGYTDKEIAQLLYYSPSRIQYVRLHMGLRRHMSAYKWPKSDIINMLMSGLPVNKISEIVGCDHAVVSYYKRTLRRDNGSI